MKCSPWLTIFATATVVLASGTNQAQAGGSQFEPVDFQGTSTFIPRSLDASPETVVVMLSGDPVALAQKHAGRPLTDGERSAVVSARKSDQAAVEPQIEKHGGQVLGDFQNAVNGIKVKIAKNRVGELRSIPGVVSVKPVGTYSLNNVVSVPYIGAPQVWGSTPPYRGQGVKIAIIDTGIDYTHANFGGPGTVAAWNAAFASSTAPANPALFGPTAPKVKGGTDLVGDNYDAGFSDAAHAAVPDPNPLDCNGHGSHVAGTAAGFGVNGAGTTYTGQYNPAAYTPGAFYIGPGVAPMAELYAVRVFGCAGSTNVVTDAIDWAVANGVDVISMSLGSDWGAADNSESDAIANASAAGVLVVAAAGNSGPTPYIASAPGDSDGAISVAAMDSTAGFPGASLALTGVPTPILVQDSNNQPYANGMTYPIVVLRNADGTVSLGCNESEYVDAIITGKLVVTLRGVCARIARAQFGFAHGAAAVAMINTSAGYPVFEGDIPNLANTGIVTIPFFGVLPGDAAKLAGPTGGPAPANGIATNAGIIANPGFQLAASFSSTGPRYGDSVLKPNTTGPGVSIVSTAMGTGNGRTTESGTSMATPHVAGVAALVKGAKRSWSIDDLRASVVQTSSPTKMSDYSPRVEGAGVVQAVGAVNTQAVVRVPDDSVSFGFADLLQPFHGTQHVTVRNNDNKAITFNISSTRVVGPASATVTFPASVTVPKHGNANVDVTLDVPANSVGGTHPLGSINGFKDVGGYLQFTPSNASMNNGVTLTVPYYLAAFSRSNLSTVATGPIVTASDSATGLTVSNTGGAIAGTPDFYELGLLTPAPQGVTYADTHAVGVRIIPRNATDNYLVFAINTFDRFSNPSPNEFDILIDTTAAGNPVGNPNFIVILANGAAISSTLPNQMVVGVLNVATNQITVRFLADTATDGSTVLGIVQASDLGLSAAHPTFAYAENHFSCCTATSGSTPGIAKFNAFTPALTVSYAGGAIAPNGSAPATVTVHAAQWAATPGLGVMIVAPDNSSTNQAQLITVN